MLSTYFMLGRYSYQTAIQMILNQISCYSEIESVELMAFVACAVFLLIVIFKVTFV